MAVGDVRQPAATSSEACLCNKHEAQQDPLRDDAERCALSRPPETEQEYCERKIRAAKRAARSELSVSKGDWRRHGYAHTAICSTEGICDTVPRVDIHSITAEQFCERFERPRLPTVITGACNAWPAASTWTLERLVERLGEHKFKVGSDDDGDAVRLRFKHYAHYATHPDHAEADDSPLYIFDGSFADKQGSASMATEYAVPPLFREDLMAMAGEHRRPPYRWFVMGPARSGSNLHVDPLATSAWNALLSGHKRWALFPPGTPRHLVLPREEGVEKEAVSWFTHVYPRTQRADWPTARPIDIVQHPGETVFVPGGWWHVVMNLDLTVAVTHNYASSGNFARVWRHAKRGRRKMSAKWLSALQVTRPDLAATAAELARRGEDASATSSSSGSSSSSDSSGGSDEEDGEKKKGVDTVDAL